MTPLAKKVYDLGLRDHVLDKELFLGILMCIEACETIKKEEFFAQQNEHFYTSNRASLALKKLEEALKNLEG